MSMMMKIKMILLVALLAPGLADVEAKDPEKPSLSKGIRFEDKSFAELLTMAKEQNKLIFLDAYTSWCGPCKLLKKKTFPDAKAGDFFNANYINAAFDMEKGEGVELAQRYRVNAYPTLLIINGNGDVVTFTKGYIYPADLIRFGKEGLKRAGKKG